MRIRLNSLQSRIAILHLAAIAFVAVLVPLANYVVLTQDAEQFEARSLRSHAQTIAGYLNYGANGWRLALPQDLQALYAHGLDGLSYAVLDQQRRPLFFSSPEAQMAPADAGIKKYGSSQGDNLYAITIEHKEGSHAVWVKVVQNIAHPDVIFDDIDASFLSRIGWLTVAILALLLAVDVWIIRRAMRPVLRSSRIASDIAPSRSDLRLPEDGVPSEMLPLIRAMNLALARLERGIQAQREFTADAAHELRTPLAVLRARIELFPDQKAVAAIRADMTAMSHVVDQLMELAEAESALNPLDQRADLRAVSCEVVTMLADLAIKQGKALVLLGENKPVWVRGDHSLIFRAVRNLVDNAIKYTAPNTEIEISVLADSKITVRDHGLGISQDDREQIFKRFWRASRNPTPGSGLGLAIVSQIVVMHQGRINVASPPSGGALFTLQFMPAKSDTMLVSSGTT
jgi:signal transduction histidine kinase